MDHPDASATSRKKRLLIALILPGLVIGGLLLYSLSDQTQDKLHRQITEALAAGQAPQAEIRRQVSPIRRTSLEPGLLDGLLRGGAWRELPFTVSNAEEAAIQQCVDISRRVHYSHNQQTEFSKPQTRDELEAILTLMPDLFYGHYLLGRWHQLHGDPELGRKHLRMAYDKAPAILVQHWAYADGSPGAGLAIRNMEIECNRVENGSLDPSLVLRYPLLETDSQGDLYLPVYDTVYRRYSYAHPADHDVSTAKLGWFQLDGPVSEMPVMELRRKLDIVVTRDPLAPVQCPVDFEHEKTASDSGSYTLTLNPQSGAPVRLVQGSYALSPDLQKVLQGQSLSSQDLIDQQQIYQFNLSFPSQSGTRSGYSMMGADANQPARMEGTLAFSSDGGKARLFFNEAIDELTEEPVPLWIALIEEDGELTKVQVFAACVVGYDQRDARFESPDPTADTLLNREVQRMVQQHHSSATQPTTQPDSLPAE